MALLRLVGLPGAERRAREQRERADGRDRPGQLDERSAAPARLGQGQDHEADRDDHERERGDEADATQVRAGLVRDRVAQLEREVGELGHGIERGGHERRAGVESAVLEEQEERVLEAEESDRERDRERESRQQARGEQQDGEAARQAVRRARRALLGGECEPRRDRAGPADGRRRRA